MSGNGNLYGQNGLTLALTSPVGGAPVANKNLVPFSASLSDASKWTRGAVTLTAGQADPFGGTGAVQLAEGGVNASHNLTAATAVALVVGQTYCFSLFGKSGSNQFSQLLAQAAASGSCFADFDLTAGTVGTNSAGTALGFTTGISSTGLAAGWWRFWITFTSQATTSGILCPWMANSASAVRAISYLGTAATTLYFGPQLEVGTSPTSYSPT